MLLILTSPEFQTHHFSAQPFSVIHQGVKRELFNWGRLVVSRRNMKLSFTSESESWLTERGRTAISVKYFVLPTHIPQKLPIWILLPNLKLTVMMYYLSFLIEQFWFNPLYWTVDRLNMRKGLINIVFLSIFKLIIFQNNRLEFFQQFSIEIISNFMSKLVGLWDWYVICSINCSCATMTKKKRNSNTPLVSLWLKFVISGF